MIQISDFTGGYNDSLYPLNISDNSFLEFINVDAMKNGGFKVRNGTKKVNNEAFDGEVTQLIEWKLKDGTTKTIVISNKKMYVLSSVIGTYNCVKYNGSDLILQRDTVAYTFFKDDFYFTDGTKMYKWSDNVNYLHNLIISEPYSFKKGDIIKLTISNKETAVGGSGTLCDIRNNLVSSISYYDEYYRNNVNGTISWEYQSQRKISNIKSKSYNSYDNCFYSLKVTSANRVDTSAQEAYDLIDFSEDFSYIIFHNKVSGSDNIVPSFCDVLYPDVFDTNVEARYGTPSHFFIQRHVLKGEFIKMGECDKYYQFTSDVDNFYPHNYDYITKRSYLGTQTIALEEIENINDIEFNITVIDFPYDIVCCKYFAYHPQSFRFFASGNEYDPCAVYYSELNDFENWETVTNTEDVVNKLYPRFNYGAVNGLVATGNSLLICYKNGFACVSGYTPDEYVFNNLSVPVGVTSSNCVAVIPNGLAFYSYGSIYLMSNSLLSYDYVKIPTENELMNISKNRCERILNGSTNHSCCYYNNKYYLCFKDNKAAEKILVYDFELNSFSLYENIKTTCLMVKENLKLYAGCQNYVVALFEDGVHTDFYNSSENVINFSVRSKMFDFSGNYMRYKLKKIYLTCNHIDYSKSDENKTNIYLTLKNEYNESVSDAHSVYEGGELWKNSLQNSLWACNDEYNSFSFDTNILFHRLGFSIDNKEKSNLKQPFIVYSLSFDIEECQKSKAMYNNDIRKIDKNVNLNYERR